MTTNGGTRRIIKNVGFAPRYEDGEIVRARGGASIGTPGRLATLDAHHDAETMRLARTYGQELPGLVELMLRQEGFSLPERTVEQEAA